MSVGIEIGPLELIGRWTLDRRIHDRLLNQRGRVEGEVEFVRDAKNVGWLERGRLSWDGHVHDVSRELSIVQTEDGWTVRFADGRDFHPWTPGRRLVHPCRADTYRGLVAVDRDGDRLRMLWDVTGPAKDLRLVTRCRRLPSST